MAKLFTDFTTEEVCIMGYIHCCGGLRETRSFKLSPLEGFILCRLDYLEECPVCGNFVIQITRLDQDNNISTVRVRNNKARKLWERIKNGILYENKVINLSARNGGFYLGYSEYGTKKRCYSNFSNLKIGLL